MTSKEELNNFISFIQDKSVKLASHLTLDLSKEEIEELIDDCFLSSIEITTISNVRRLSTHLLFVIKTPFDKTNNISGINLNLVDDKYFILTNYFVPFITFSTYNIGFIKTLDMFNFKHLKKSDIFKKINEALDNNKEFTQIKAIAMKNPEYKKIMLIQDDDKK